MKEDMDVKLSIELRKDVIREPNGAARRLLNG